MEAEVAVRAPEPPGPPPGVAETLRDRQWKAADAVLGGVFVAVALFVLIFSPGRFEDKFLGALTAVGIAVALDLLQDFAHRFVRKRRGARKPNPRSLAINARLHARWPRIFPLARPDADPDEDLHRQRHKIAFIIFGLLMLQWLREAAELNPQGRGSYMTMLLAGITAAVITWTWVGAAATPRGRVAARGAVTGAVTAAVIGLIALLLFKVGFGRLLLQTILMWGAVGYAGGQAIERAWPVPAALRAVLGITLALVGFGLLTALFAWPFPWPLHLMIVAGWGAAFLLYRPAGAALEPARAA